MYLSLAPEYVLRGWEKLPFSVVNIKTGRTLFLSQNDFELLMCCDGNHNIDSIQIQAYQYYISQGIVRISDARLADKQHYKIYNNRFVESAHWAITNTCNYKCKHCFLSAPHSSESYIAFDDCRRIIDELYDVGIF